MKTMVLSNSILGEKCPKCGKGHVYKNNSNRFIHIPRMNETCDICHYRFDREQGYFIGAMYISYALAVFQGIVTFLICHYVFDFSIFLKVLLPCLVIILFSFPNFRRSRVIWMNIFPD